MSLIEKNNLNYLSRVEQFYLSLKNSGLAISAADYYLISEWEKRGVPMETLCRAIAFGFDRYKKISRNQKVSLTYFKKFIEEEIQKTA